MAPMVGWGQVLPLYVEHAEVINVARAGASSKSFLERGRLAWILDNIAPGDLLLISFGLIDMKPGDGRYVLPFHGYQQLLRRYVHEARDKGAHPVLITSPERRVFDAFGNMRRPLGLYPMAMREVGINLSVPVIDLNEWSADWWRREGPDGTKELFVYLEPGEHPNYPQGVADNTHLRARGSLECARFVANEMNAQHLLTPEYFRNLDVELPESEVEFVDDAIFEELTRLRVGNVPTGNKESRV